MQAFFTGQVPKSVCYPDDLEDALCLAPAAGLFALSDGASESFDSKTWARLLVSRFIEDPKFGASWLEETIRRYAGAFDHARFSWAQEAACARGSFATLLGIEVNGADALVRILAVGDSQVVLTDGGELVKSFPYSRASEFGQRPELVGTKEQHNSFLSSPEFASSRIVRWSLADVNDPSLLCMTDALGEWALREAEDGRPAWARLASIARPEELESLVFSERGARKMRVDDTTLVNLCLEM